MLEHRLIALREKALALKYTTEFLVEQSQNLDSETLSHYQTQVDFADKQVGDIIDLIKKIDNERGDKNDKQL